jgi:hypothetical protein
MNIGLSLYSGNMSFMDGCSSFTYVNKYNTQINSTEKNTQNNKQLPNMDFDGRYIYIYICITSMSYAYILL